MGNISVVVKSVFSPKIRELEDYNPDGESFRIPIEVEIGEEGQDGGELFYLTVASGAWVREKAGDSGGLLGHGYLIVNCFDYNSLFNTLSAMCRRCSDSTWDGVVCKLRRFMGWEFDNYREYEPKENS
jgi:hypothetical protein